MLSKMWPSKVEKSFILEQEFRRAESLKWWPRSNLCTQFTFQQYKKKVVVLSPTSRSPHCLLLYYSSRHFFSSVMCVKCSQVHKFTKCTAGGGGKSCHLAELMQNFCTKSCLALAAHWGKWRRKWPLFQRHPIDFLPRRKKMANVSYYFIAVFCSSRLSLRIRTGQWLAIGFLCSKLCVFTLSCIILRRGGKKSKRAFCPISLLVMERDSEEEMHQFLSSSSLCIRFIINLFPLFGSFTISLCRVIINLSWWWKNRNCCFPL